MRRLITFGLLLIALLATQQAWADDTTADTLAGYHYYDVKKPLLYEERNKSDANVQTEIKKDNKLVYSFSHWRALTGRNCVVNDVWTTVGVASWPSALGKMTNDTLSDYTAFVNGVGADVAYNPITSVRDMTRHYAAGTTAGFCIGQEGGESVLDIKLIQKFSLEFYLEGRIVGRAYAQNGSNFNGVNVSLGSLPGSSNATYNIQAEAPQEFDEIRLVNTGVQVSVISGLDVHYAYVGKPNLYTLTNKTDGVTSTEKDFDDYCTDYGLTKTADVSGPTKLVDANITNSVVGKTVIMIGSTIPLKARTYTSGESFEGGSVVGFRGVGGSGLDLSLLGGGMLIRTWDKSNNEVERFNMSHSVLALNLGNGGPINLSFITTKPFSGVSIQYTGLLNLDLGATVFNYAFVEPAPDIDHHCDIDPSPDMNICDDQTTAQLYHNNKVPVEWSSVSGGASIDQNGHVTGMTGKGPFVFRAKSTDDDCYDDVTITKNQGNTSGAVKYENVISKDNGFEKAEHVPGTTGALISISKFDDDDDHLLDGKKDTYAKYIGGLKLADHVGVVAIQTKDKAKTFRGALSIEQTDSFKIGFVVRSKGTGLNLNLLNGFSMEFYKNNSNVKTIAITQANVLDVGLIGKDNLQKMELGVVVPPDLDFDQMALYHNDVLSVDLSEMDFYYPFYTVGANIDKADDPLGCNPTVVSAVVKTNPEAKTPSSGASIDGNLTKTYSTVNVGGGIGNLSNLIDGSVSTGTTIGNVANVGGGTTIAVKLGRKVDYRHQLAIVMDNNNYQSIFTDKKTGKGLDPLGVGAGTWMTVETALNGKKTGEKKTDWNVLGADVLTTKGHNIYVWNPKKQYDEVIISLAGIAKVAGVQKIYAIELQSDIDGDGVPDCKDDDSCNGEVEDENNPQACLNSDITFSFTGKTGFHYYIEAADQTDDLLTTTSTINGDGTSGKSTFSHTLTTTKSGQFSARILMESTSTEESKYKQVGVINYTVHPLLTHWNPNTTSTDWNTWSNWIEGSPYLCTDVVIPTGAKVYPILKDKPTTTDNTTTTDDATTISNNYNACKGIHFEPGAAVENVYKLNYTSAWVDLGLKNGEASLWMAPLAHVYSGDLYVSNIAEANYFKALDVTDDEANNTVADPVDFNVRTNPYVYQRVWKEVVSSENYSGTQKAIGGDNKMADVTLIDEGTWTHAFNGLTQDYGSTTTSWGKKYAPRCFSLMANDNTTSDTTYVIHLPKAGDRTYYYYDALGNVKGKSETVPHDATKNNKLWSEAYWKDKLDNGYSDNLVLHYSNTDAEQGGVFLVGNPMMSHLDAETFLSTNSSTISGIKLYKQSTTTSIIEVDGNLISSEELTADDRYIAPASAFFAVSSADNKTKNLEVTYTTSMFGGKTSTVKNVSRKNTLGLLRVTAKTDKYASGTVLLEGNDAKAATLIDEDYKPSLALFSIDHGRAYDIRPKDSDVVELGIFMAKADSVRLDFHAEGRADVTGWKLYDRETGMSYESGEAPLIVMDGSNIGRFYLSRIGSVDDVKKVEAKSDVYVTTTTGKAVVTSTRDNLAKVEVFNAGGMLLDTATANGASRMTVSTQPGVIIIKATLLDGKTKTFKLMAE